MKIILQRIYEDLPNTQCARILVDRLWPRGISKERARLDHWWKELAPSDELRKWFRHEAPRWEEFKTRYLLELESQRARAEELWNQVKDQECVLLLYSAKDQEHNQAVVLKEFLETNRDT